MLTAAEIIQLIESCSKNGVTKLKVENVILTFTGYKPPSAFTNQPGQAILDQIRNDSEWLEQEIPPAPMPREE